MRNLEFEKLKHFTTLFVNKNPISEGQRYQGEERYILLHRHLGLMTLRAAAMALGCSRDTTALCAKCGGRNGQPSSCNTYGSRLWLVLPSNLEDMREGSSLSRCADHKAPEVRCGGNSGAAPTTPAAKASAHGIAAAGKGASNASARRALSADLTSSSLSGDLREGWATPEAAAHSYKKRASATAASRCARHLEPVSIFASFARAEQELRYRLCFCSSESNS